MKYKSIEDLKKLIINETLVTPENDRDIEADFDIILPDISIDARDIKARDINALDIKSRDINAWDINAWDIDARYIDAQNIKARDIDARDIDARDINYYAYCIAYKSITVRSISGRRPNSFHKCLDSEIVYINN